MQRKLFVAALFAPCLAACSTSSPDSPGSTYVSGTLSGRSLSPAYAIAAKGIEDPAYPGQVTVLIGNASNACQALQDAVTNPNQAQGNMLLLTMVLGETSANATVAPGTYSPTGDPDELQAQYASYSAACALTGSNATAGAVNLVASGSNYTGTFDLTFGPDHVTGSFDAPICEITLPDAGGGDDAGDGGSDASDGGVVCVPS